MLTTLTGGAVRVEDAAGAGDVTEPDVEAQDGAAAPDEQDDVAGDEPDGFADVEETDDEPKPEFTPYIPPRVE